LGVTRNLVSFAYFPENLHEFAKRQGVCFFAELSYVLLVVLVSCTLCHSSVRQVSRKSALLLIRLGAAQEVTGLRLRLHIHLEFSTLLELK
jgi:hypothetical protein